MSSSPCPHCGNTMGFTFGTCIECGWNSLDGSFSRIEVSVSDLLTSDPSLVQYLIDKHGERTKDLYRQHSSNPTLKRDTD